MTTARLRRVLVHLLPAAALLALIAPRAVAQPYVYALDSRGRLYVNGEKIDTLTGGAELSSTSLFGLSDPSVVTQIWGSVAVDGADWWNLRFDGRLTKSGAKFDDLDAGGLSALWGALTAFDGHAWALRSDGRLHATGEGDATLPTGDGNFYFAAIADNGSRAFSLRSDGRVYEGLSSSALFRFKADDGLDGAKDGEAAWTEWLALGADPASGELYAVRRDGQVGRADPGAFSGTGDDGSPPEAVIVATLPFVDNVSEIDAGKLYSAITVLADGSFRALRGDGRVYGPDSNDPLVNYPGDPTDLNDGLYVKIVPNGDDWVVLRESGRLYFTTDTEALLDLPKDGFLSLDISSTLPDLANTKKRRPSLATYRVVAFTGDDVTVPVVVTDVDTENEGVTVTVDPTTLPEGASYDAESRTLSWPDVGPAGRYRIRVTADDGESKPVTRSYVVRVRDPDEVPEKNRKPVVARIKKARPLDNAEFQLTVVAFDPDGDPVTLRVDEAAFPFDDGATFDPETGLFTWTPRVQDVGKAKVTFFASDGTVEVKRRIGMRVDATLTTFP